MQHGVFIVGDPRHETDLLSFFRAKDSSSVDHFFGPGVRDPYFWQTRQSANVGCKTDIDFFDAKSYISCAVSNISGNCYVNPSSIDYSVKKANYGWSSVSTKHSNWDMEHSRFSHLSIAFMPFW